jgi:hypothetical protein
LIRLGPRFSFLPATATPGRRPVWLDRAVALDDLLRLTNRNMIAFDLALGTGALLAPDATLRVIGHEPPSDDARHLFRRAGPIWLTFAAAHLVAERRGEPRDWWALAWLRGTEIATDVVWARSAAVSRPGAKAGLWLAGAANVAMAAGFARLARRS